MHDPLTVAFEILNPFRVRVVGKQKMRDPLVTIWHRDPESDGSDDSCGWYCPKISREQRKKIIKLARDERDFMVGDLGYMMNPIELIYWIYRLLAWRLHGRRESLTYKETVLCLDLAINPTDNLRWHCQAALENPEEFETLFLLVYRQYLRLHRPWWKHPRYHLHHWRIQIHPLQNLKRFIFKRCAACGKRFPWNYSPILSNSKTFHHKCYHDRRTLRG